MIAIPNGKLMTESGAATPVMLHWMNAVSVEPAPLPPAPQLGQVVVGVGGAADISFGAIPATFNALRLSITGRIASVTTWTALYLMINGDAVAANYWNAQDGYDAGSSHTAASRAATTAGGFFSWVAGVSGNADALCTVSVLLPNYSAAALFRGYMSQYGGNSNAVRTGAATGVWKSAATVNALKVIAPGSTWVAGTIATLYGM